MSEERLERLEAIVESNSRAIQAMLEQRVTDRHHIEELIASDRARIEVLENLTQRMASLQEGLIRMLTSLDEDRPIILRRLMKIEDKVDRLLERNGGE